ncbi:hypothetical protein M422DRAFT_118702, partial [Sphaerobolus stellatus SS14]
LEARMNDLRSRKSKLEAFREMTQGLFAPIRRLFPEILAEIFIHCVEIYSYDGLMGSKDISWDSGPFFLQRICRRWHRIVQLTPRLFTTIVLHRGRSSSRVEPIFALSTYLAQSGSLPLTISL